MNNYYFDRINFLRFFEKRRKIDIKHKIEYQGKNGLRVVNDEA